MAILISGYSPDFLDKSKDNKTQWPWGICCIGRIWEDYLYWKHIPLQLLTNPISHKTILIQSKQPLICLHRNMQARLTEIMNEEYGLSKCFLLPNVPLDSKIPLTLPYPQALLAIQTRTQEGFSELLRESVVNEQISCLSDLYDMEFQWKLPDNLFKKIYSNVLDILNNWDRFLDLILNPEMPEYIPIIESGQSTYVWWIRFHTDLGELKNPFWQYEDSRELKLFLAWIENKNFKLWKQYEKIWWVQKNKRQERLEARFKQVRKYRNGR